MVPHLCLLTLLLVWVSASPDCSSPGSCYGSSSNCRPNIDCHVLLHFDQQGNLDIHMRNVTSPNGYVAVSVDPFPDHQTEYLICIPHQQKRVRASGGGSGNSARIVEENMARYFRQTSTNDFVCSFVSSEIPPEFYEHRTFFVTEGQYSDELVIPLGTLLDSVVFEAEQPVIHPVSGSANGDRDGVMSPTERKRTSDVLEKLKKLSENEDEDDMEDSLANHQSEDDLDDMLDSKKKYSTHRRQKERENKRRQKEEDEDEADGEELEEHQKPRRGSGRRGSPREKENDPYDELPEHQKPRRGSGRPSRYDEDDDEEDEEDDKPQKNSKRPFRDDSDEEEEHEKKSKKRNRNGKGKKGGKKEDDEYSYDDEENYDDDENSSHGPYGQYFAITWFYLILISRLAF